MNRLSKIAFAAASAAAFTLAATPSHAYRMIQNTSVGRVSAGAAVACNASGGFTHWTKSSIPWRLNTSRAPANAATEMQSSLQAWTNVSNANHNLSYAGTSSAAFVTNGENTVLFARGNGCTGSCLAITALVLQSGQVIVETDISFNSRYAWKTDGSDYDFQAVCTHELGHTLGVHHTEVTGTPRPTMYSVYFGTGGRTLETDDQSALQCSQSRYPVP